jgi:tripeptidyl-peptidase-1
MEVSEHNSQRYGKYYSAEEVVELFSPSFNAVDAVREWLENSGIAADRVTRSVNKQWLQFEAATSELEELLKTEYHLYEHETTGKHNIACDEYHVPEHVKQHIE